MLIILMAPARASLVGQGPGPLECNLPNKKSLHIALGPEVQATFSSHRLHSAKCQADWHFAGLVAVRHPGSSGT